MRFGEVASLLFGLAHLLEVTVLTDHISQAGTSSRFVEVRVSGATEFAMQIEGLVKLPASAYPRQREYPHPPPPRRNNTRRTIKIVVILHTSSRFSTVQIEDQC